jgi:hypothetical protein
MLSYFRLSSILFLAILIFASSCSQPEPEETNDSWRKSPIAIAKTLHQPTDTYMKIIYGQPYKRGRKIFGELVPYNEVWRTGANEATELTTTRDILWAGQKLEAGTYELFCIPRENEPWTIILNNQLGQWGAFDYQSTSDELRVDIPAAQTESSTEAFTIEFAKLDGDSTQVVMGWDKTKVSIPVQFVESHSSEQDSSSL